MPGPGPHMLYALGTGQALTTMSNGRFSPQHCIIYAVNAFMGPDLGSFSEWLSSTFELGDDLGSLTQDLIHHPLYYILILGYPLCLFYCWVSRVLLQKGLLDSFSGLPLTRRQCFLLVSAGSLTHFFLDNLFEENGQSSMYTWILSTGWWDGPASVNPDAVVVVGFLCTCLIGGFVYINRVNSFKSIRKKSNESMKLFLIIASLYCLWCASQMYLVDPRRPAVGEEADLGVLVFLGIFFFLPHCLCMMSMSPKDNPDIAQHFPL